MLARQQCSGFLIGDTSRETVEIVFRRHLYMVKKSDGNPALYRDSFLKRKKTRSTNVSRIRSFAPAYVAEQPNTVANSGSSSQRIVMEILRPCISAIADGTAFTLDHPKFICIEGGRELPAWLTIVAGKFLKERAPKNGTSSDDTVRELINSKFVVDKLLANRRRGCRIRRRLP